MTDIEIWQLVLGSSLFSALFTAAVSHIPKLFSDHRNAKAIKEANALYAAIALEEFGVSCAHVAWDMDDYYNTQGSYGRSHTELPKLSDLRSQVDLKALDISVWSRIFALITKINLENAAIEDDYQQTRLYSTDNYAVERGRDAFLIAADIRKTIKLKREPYYTTDRAVTELDVYYDKLLARREVVEQNRKAFEAANTAKLEDIFPDNKKA